MLVRNFCIKCFKERFGNHPSVCPVKDKPHLCKYGKLCWETKAETTEEIEEDMRRLYELTDTPQPKEKSSTN